MSEELKEIVIDDSFGSSEASDTVTKPDESKPSESEPAKQQQDEHKPQPWESPSNKAFAQFRIENSRLKQQNEALERQIKESRDSLNGKVVLDSDNYNRFLEVLAIEDPEAYQAELHRMTREEATSAALQEVERRFAPQKQAAESSIDHNTFNEINNSVLSGIAQNFPEVDKVGSEANAIFLREIDSLVGAEREKNPAEFAKAYAKLLMDESGAGARRLFELAELSQFRAERQQQLKQTSETGRQSRVNQQGATNSSPSQNTSKHQLTPEEAQFAKDNGWTPEEYAAWLARNK